MRRLFCSTYAVSALLLALLLSAGLLVTQPAAAQTPTEPLIGYHQTIAGEVTSPNGTEHLFTGCAGEVVDITVAADDFAPRLELYGADDDEPLDSATAPSSDADDSTNRTIVLEAVSLPATGLYTILVSGRSRGDRGGYSVTLQGMGADGTFLDEGPSSPNLAYDQVVTGTVLAGRVEQWNFRGCEGDTIRAQVAGNGFAPELQLYSVFAESPIATAVPDEGSDGVSAEFSRPLPDTGIYDLLVAGASRTDAGDYELEFALVNAAQPKPTVISEFTPTPEPTATSSTGPRPRRGTPRPNATPNATPTPTAAQTEPTATFTPTPTPEFIMPGVGEGAFNVLDVSSEGGPVNHVAYSPDGFVFVTAGEDGAVRAWDSFTGELLETMLGHENRVNYVAFDPNDELLASAGDDGTVRLWDEEGEEVATLEMPDDGVNSVAFSPDGASLVATTDAGDVVVWDVVDESIRFELEGHEGPVYHALFSPDGTLIATGDGAGVVRTWNGADGELVDTMPVNAGPGSGDPILSIAFSSDGTTIVVGGVIGVNQASVHIWDLALSDQIGELVGHTEWGSTATISPDSIGFGETYILSAGRAEPGHDGPAPSTARLWNTETGELAIAFVGFPSSVVAAIFRADGDELLFSDGNYVYIWPAPMISVLTATFGEAVGVQMPVPTAVATPATPRATPTPTPTSAVTRAPTPTLIPTATLTPTPFTPPVSLEIFCTVITDRLNLRPGPGTNFNPPLAVLETGKLLVVVGRNADGSWLQVAVLDDNLEPEITGWVSADFLFCVGEIEDAPVVEVE